MITQQNDFGFFIKSEISIFSNKLFKYTTTPTFFTSVLKQFL